MSAPEMLRPSEAAKRYGVSTDTLWRWARAGLIGRSQVAPNLVVYVASDIADVLRSRLVPRQVVPLSPEVIEANRAAIEDDWRNDPFWAGTKGQAR